MDEPRPLKLRYTPTARSEVAGILGYVGAQSPRGLRDVEMRLRNIIELLPNFPLCGAATRRPGLRRVIVPHAPHIIFYRIEREAIVAVGVRHPSRKPRLP